MEGPAERSATGNAAHPAAADLCSHVDKRRPQTPRNETRIAAVWDSIGDVETKAPNIRV